MCHKINLQLRGVQIKVWLMQNFIRPRIHNNEVWGKFVEHLKIPNA